MEVCLKMILIIVALKLFFISVKVYYKYKRNHSLVIYSICSLEKECFCSFSSFRPRPVCLSVYVCMGTCRMYHPFVVQYKVFGVIQNVTMPEIIVDLD
jgi:hypothetical protein